MTMHVDEKTTVRDVVAHYPQTRPVFENFGIDYCCGGHRSLTDAASQRGLQFTALVDALQQAVETPRGDSSEADRDWHAAPLEELVNHIVEVHHGYLKSTLPRLESMVLKVLNAHRAQHGEMLTQVLETFMALSAELSSHLMKEERMLFPYIVALEAHVRHGAAEPYSPFGSARNPIRQMEHEHESAGAALATLRAVTGDYALPSDACQTFQAVYEELQRLERDLHQHIHLENNILFPRAVELEEVSSARA